jgi:hypothetical protein
MTAYLQGFCSKCAARFFLDVARRTVCAVEFLCVQKLILRIYKRNRLRLEFFLCNASLLSLSAVSADGHDATAGLYQLQSYTGRAVFPVTSRAAQRPEFNKRGNVTYNVTKTRVRVTIFFRGKAVLHVLSVCVCVCVCVQP